MRIWKLPLCVERTGVARDAVASGMIPFYLPLAGQVAQPDEAIVIARLRRGQPWSAIEPVLDGLRPGYTTLGGLELLGE